MRKVNFFKKLRKDIDEIDKKIVKFLEKRLKLVQKLNLIKESEKLPLSDLKREKEIIEKLKIIASHPLLKEFVESFYQGIFKLSKLERLVNLNENLPFKKIGIIGLGVIGGSIVKTLKYKDRNIKISTLNTPTAKKDIELAKKEKYLDEIFDLKNLVNNSELIIIATPIEIIVPSAKEIKKEFKNDKNLIVIDVGSIKEKIAKEFEKLTDEKIEFLATHPMAGSDKVGFENSKIGLFINYPWIITPHSKNKEETIEKIKLFVEYLGGRPKILAPKDHDKIVARVSHLVFLISKLLFSYVYDLDKKYLEYSGTGFETTTRLTSGNPLMYSQIYKNNFENIQKELKNFIAYLKKIKIKPKESFQFFERYKRSRDKFYENRKLIGF
jgi:prephenate dehydrogenase